MRPNVPVREMKKTRSRRFIELSGVLIFAYIIKWLMHPISEYETLKRRRDNVHRLPDILYVEGRPDAGSAVDAVNKLIDISIVVPAFNEADRLPLMLDDSLPFLQNWCSDNKLSYEVLIVDDASTDQTKQVALGYSTEHKGLIRVLRLGENHGKGGAVKLGVQKARGEYILMVDADGATDIRDLDKLYTQLKSIQQNNENSNNTISPVGIALGSRAHLEKSSIATRAFYRTVLMRGFHVLVMLLCTRHVKDTQCGFKLFTKKAAKVLFQSLHIERWAFDIEIIYLAEMLKIPMTEVAVQWHEVEGSKLIQTKFDVVKTSLTMARDMLFVKVAYSLGWWKIEV